jgi:hypothetical protein
VCVHAYGVMNEHLLAATARIAPLLLLAATAARGGLFTAHNWRIEVCYSAIAAAAVTLAT